MYNKIAVMSDFHFDFWMKAYQYRYTSEQFVQILVDRVPKDCDLIVIAGDIYNGFVEWISEIVTDIPIITIPGNHDFYSRDLPLNPSFYVDDHVCATTLWTNFSGGIGSEMQIYNGIADSRAIKNTGAYKVQNLCDQSYKMIRHYDREIVVTHFPPSRQSTADRYKGDPYNPYFVNNFDSDLNASEHNIKLWICGHVHHRHSYHIGDILVVCNPLGYPMEHHRGINTYYPEIIEKIDGKWQITTPNK